MRLPALAPAAEFLAARAIRSFSFGVYRFPRPRSRRASAARSF